MPLLAERDIETALLLAADAAYYRPATFTAGPSSYAVVSEVMGMSCIAIRGTMLDKLPTLLTDIDVLPEHDRVVGWCHAGFLNAANAILQNCLAVATRGPYIMGLHSLGAGEGIIIAAKLAALGFPPMRLSTFGCPKFTASTQIADFLEHVPGYRWRNGNDPVPLVPPRYNIDRLRTQIGVDRFIDIEAHMTDAYMCGMKTVEWI